MTLQITINKNKDTRLKIRHQISALIAGMLLVTIILMGAISYEKGRSAISGIIEHNLMITVETMVEKITLIVYNTDSRDFNRNLSYFITKQNSGFSQQNLDAVLFFLDKEGRLVQAHWIYDYDFSPLPQEDIDQIFEKRQGILHTHWRGKDYTIAYCRIAENGWTYAAALEDRQYLAPVFTLGKTIAITGAIIILIGIFASLAGAALITRPLTALIKSINQVSTGNISIRLKENEPIPEFNNLARSFNGMLQGMCSFFTLLLTGVNRIFKAGANISVLADNSHQQIIELEKSYHGVMERAALQKTMISDFRENLSQANQRIDNLLENLNKSAENSKSSDNRVKEGQDHLIAMESKFEQIMEVVSSTYRDSCSLSKTAGEINRYTENIREISKQTKLLALNANIEAVRSGVAGSGFQVVAQEINKLAQNSFIISEEIGNLISSILEQSRSVLEMAGRGEQAVMEGKDLMKKNDRVFKEILASTLKTHQEVITAQSNIREITGQVNNLDLFMNSIEEYTDNAIINAGYMKDFIHLQKDSVIQVQEQGATLKNLGQEVQEVLLTYSFSDTQTFRQ